MFNPFQVIGIEQKFSLDLNELEQKYLDLMKTYHPDKVVGVEDPNQRISFISKSTQINDAYNILKDDLKRGQVIIDLEKDHQHFNENVVKQDAEFIFLQIQMREQIDKLSRNFVEQEFNNLKTKAKSLVNENKQALEQAFIENNLELAQKLVYRLQFLAKLKSEIEKVEDEQLI
ncbi:Fe-S protein assembly co-chaperone HscB [Psittacicella gerlachiana]|nr:Fe-S protein assembly co-chaperone HscB [Psittacicella gerlachiana]